MVEEVASQSCDYALRRAGAPCCFELHFLTSHAWGPRTEIYVYCEESSVPHFGAELFQYVLDVGD